MNIDQAENVDRHRKWTSAAGLECVIHDCVFSSRRYHLCGYVSVPEGHPLFGLSYSDDAPQTLDATIEKVKNSPIGKRGIIDVFCAAGRERLSVGVLFDVHGGITYSDKYPPGEPTAIGWWLGFDCGHCDDDPSIQDEAYVRAECESLAQQIAALQG